MLPVAGLVIIAHPNLILRQQMIPKQLMTLSPANDLGERINQVPSNRRANGLNSGFEILDASESPVSISKLINLAFSDTGLLNNPLEQPFSVVSY